MKDIKIKPGISRSLLVQRKNVAAYCRVSTQQEKQHHSLEAQQEYFAKRIGCRPGWIFVGVYADEASGRNNKRMREFQRMMADCREGKIDLILVKSISRLGRNTLQFLLACDELNRLGVEVYFEIEKVYISDPKAMKALTIYAGLFQDESENKSFSIRWGNTTRLQNGTSRLYDRICYGYKHDEADHLIPDPYEAEVVRKIFRWRCDGVSLRKISALLSEERICAPRGGTKWSIETIRKILNNEKYFGNVLLQKTYVADFFTGKQRENQGELEKFLITGHHEAIVTTYEF